MEQSLQINDLFSVADKVVLVTGGSRGIGLMIAHGFVVNGAKVYISSRKTAVCDATAAELSKLGTCISVPADLSTAEGRDKLVSRLKAEETSLDVLVNNAGAAWGAPFADYPESGYDKVMDINVKAIFMLTQSLLPLLEANASTANPARVINIGSIDGIQVPNVDNYAYSASKAAVHHLTKVLGVRLGRQGITVNAIAPGPFASKMTAWMLENFQAQIEGRCPLGRIGQTADMAGVALYLASAAAAYVNGVVIPVDGGLHLA
ncbi:MAG: SDR family oxidoreductase [Chloroflexota bacterium]